MEERKVKRKGKRGTANGHGHDVLKLEKEIDNNNNYYTSIYTDQI
jgi:hypothetical protein